MARNGWQPEPEIALRGRPRVGGGYRAEAAHLRASALSSKPRVERKLVPGSALFLEVVERLRSGLSPEQIAFTLRSMPDPVRLSHETIYTALYAMPRGQLRARVLTLLRRVLDQPTEKILSAQSRLPSRHNLNTLSLASHLLRPPCECRLLNNILRNRRRWLAYRPPLSSFYRTLRTQSRGTALVRHFLTKKYSE
jgi:hypothetical protein